MPPRPPRMALQACQSMSEGDVCSFVDRPGRITGQCRHLPDGLFACAPEGPPGGQGGGFPPERVSIQDSYSRSISVKSKLPDTHQGSCFDENHEIPCSSPGSAFYGQDAHYTGAMPSYHSNGDGTVTDNVTGLMWQKGHNEKRLAWADAQKECQSLNLGGFHDWRLPSIKELFSITDFRGAAGLRPYLDDVFEIKEPSANILRDDPFASTHRTSMMGQTWSATVYTGEHWGRRGIKAAFFFNFLDGRIKQAPVENHPELFYRCVRGNEWGKNRLSKKSSQIISDELSGLEWQTNDSGRTMDWKGALRYCESLDYGGHSDWRLPNVKELQSIVDYRKHDPALDLNFFHITDRKGWFWSSTTLGDNISQAAYVCFGKCISTDGTDVHGAGAQRSDPKTGDPSQYNGGQGGQMDEIRILNYARCVRSRE